MRVTNSGDEKLVKSAELNNVTQAAEAYEKVSYVDWTDAKSSGLPRMFCGRCGAHNFTPRRLQSQIYAWEKRKGIIRGE